MWWSKKDEQPATIFLHIPKTAGTTLQQMIHHNFKEKEIFYFSYGKRKKKENQTWSDVFKAMPARKRRQIKVLYGHHVYGLHEFFPQDARYISILRDPIERIISHYNFVLKNKNHYLHGIVSEKKMTLKDYVTEAGSMELNNGQTRILYGKHTGFKFGGNQAELYERVLEHINTRFIAIGLQEEFDKTVELFAGSLGWKVPAIESKLVSEQKTDKNSIPADTRAAIEEFNQLDIKLYEYVKKLYFDKSSENI